jgi:hypothetical protein
MRVLDALEQLLECAEELLDPPTCRQFINPGGVAPFDVCSTSTSDGITYNGQVWTGHVSSQQGWPITTGLPLDCIDNFAETIQVGVVRCAQGKLTNKGQPPAAALVTADAEQQELDRLALRNAILCCLGLEGKDLIIVDWNPVEPEGGCVGGIWTITIRDGGCDCGLIPDS